VVPVISALGGLLFVASAVSADGTDLRSSNTDLEALVESRADDVAQLRSGVRDLQLDIDQVARDVGSEGLATVRRRIAAISTPAGLTPVEGPGLVVTLDDSPLEEPPGDLDANALIVHQQDIQAFVNAMWAGAATAVSLQGQRLISTTGIKCVGNTVVLQGVPYAPPYRIEAVGDPALLKASLRDSDYVDFYRDYVDEVQLGLDVEPAERLALPGYEETPALVYATPG